ncbi:MAG: adenylate/guanylate cyclase domain-containing protein [Spirochaetales bacterium]|nr:adenylate/guanylate cyclase domain-containing protein [Spirochaetales bacterium]
MLKKLLLMGIIPAAIIAVFTVLEAASVLAPLEHRAYDLSLAVRPEPPADQHLLLVAVDDPAIEFSKTVWPWPRDLMARGMLHMREFGASQIVLDILYEQPSAPGINSGAYAAAAKTYTAAFNDLKDYFLGLEDSLRRGMLSLRDLPAAARDYAAAIDSTKQDLLDRMNDITENRDEMLGNAARAFGHAFFAVNLSLDPEAEPGKRLAGLDQALQKKFFLSNATVNGRIAASAVDIVPPVGPVLSGARAFGFPVTESQIDQPDGVTRRINLFYKLQDKAMPQLGLVGLLDYLGDPAVEIKSDAVVLKGARRPGAAAPDDIVIPLTEDGTMLINWTRQKPQHSYKAVSFKELLQLDKLEDEIVSNLETLADKEALGAYTLAPSRGMIGFLGDFYAPLQSSVRDILAGRERTNIDDYRKAHDRFLTALAGFTAPAKEEELVQSVLAEDAAVKKEIIDTTRRVFGDSREKFALLKKIRDFLADRMNGAVCFTSWTASATTDLGVTPFIGNYENVGTHMTVVNTILQKQFLDNVPWWVTSLIAAVFTLLAYLFVFAIKRPLVSVLAGLGTVLAETGGILLVFVLSGVYLGLVAPAASVLLVFVIFTVVNFLSTAKEKNFIRHAFANYVSKEILNEIVADPSKINLGGEEKQLTALFTDIKGFSGFSEKLAPPRLVSLLNVYFTDMANIIIDLKGYLDKYVGDAIVSFFGAPTALDGHARAACLAAVRMKRAETLMNEKLMAEELAPKPLLTRIGINTGEMLVGNMGSANRLNYTVMGHHVNLASRLEGVNKQYGTWILMSEATQKAAGGSFLARRLDRVRVVGIKQPVRLYELIDEKEKVRPELFETIGMFHAALELFEEREWDKARAAFKEILKLKPDDAPSQVYLTRCLEYRRKPPAVKWDGVFSLTSK